MTERVLRCRGGCIHIASQWLFIPGRPEGALVCQLRLQGQVMGVRADDTRRQSARMEQRQPAASPSQKQLPLTARGDRALHALADAQRPATNTLSATPGPRWHHHPKRQLL